MAIFNSYVSLPEVRSWKPNEPIMTGHQKHHPIARSIPNIQTSDGGYPLVNVYIAIEHGDL
jgi:hypothetical protein